MLSIYLLAFVLTFFWFQYLWSRHKLYILSWKLPGPFAYPIIGNALMAGDPNSLLQRINEMRYQYKDNIRFWVGQKLFVYIYHPDDIQTILTSPDSLDKSSLNKFTENVIGHGLLSLEKNLWTKHRKLINPSFSHRVLLSFFPIFNSELDILVKKFENFVGNGDFSVLELVMRCNLDIVCHTTMGTKLNTQNMENEEILDAFTWAKFLSGIRICTPSLHPYLVFRLSKWYKIQERSRNTLTKFLNYLIDLKSSRENNNNIIISNKSYNCEDIRKSEYIFIDRAIKLVHWKQFTWSDVRNESNAIVAAALDTTALAITNIIQCLAMYPECQEKVIEEVRSIFSSEKFDVTYEDTKNMVYCDLVINETLRLFPAGPLLGRRVTKDILLKNNLIIPKDTEIVIDQLGQQRDPEFWGPTANTFDPTRFCDSEYYKKIHPYVYLPFSKGPRNCIGRRHAMLSLKVFMAKIFRKYRFTTDQKLDDFKFRMDVTLTSLVKPTVRIHKL